MRPTLLLILVCSLFSAPSWAQSFSVEDLKAFRKSIELMESSKAFDSKSASTASDLVLPDLNAFTDLAGAMSGVMSGSMFDGAITESGEVIVFQSLANAVSTAGSGEQQAFANIARESGFRGIDDWAKKSDAIMAAFFTDSVGPMLGELGAMDHSAIQERSRGRQRGDANLESQMTAMQDALKTAGLPGSGSLGKSLSNAGIAFGQEKMLEGVQQMLGSQSGMMQRLNAVVENTSQKDVEMLRKNKDLLPKDMRN